MIFDALQSTTSLNEKRDMVNCVPTELKDDFQFCLEVITGKHKLGYKYYHTSEKPQARSTFEGFSIKSLYEFLQTPLNSNDLSDNNIHMYVVQTQHYADFLEPLCNRTLRLGINKSLLGKTSTTPMLAKKFEGMLPRSNGYFLTEKLDGNRCIAYFDDQQQQWQFMSRNGKRMNVEFSMRGFDKDRIYDGEILSREQVELSNDIFSYVTSGIKPQRAEQLSLFNTTSGVINRKDKYNKSLIYNIFDIVDEHLSYAERRTLLNGHMNSVDDVRILPTLMIVANKLTLEEIIPEILGQVTELGGEGLMINLAEPFYEHKRTNSLLKYKDVQTMDMRVEDVEWGNGKYEGQIGALVCSTSLPDGSIIRCKVGSGLSDKQRDEWTDERKIVGKIVEVEYFSVSQAQNSDTFSLRFPRLKKVREDKNTTSTY